MGWEPSGSSSGVLPATAMKMGSWRSIADLVPDPRQVAGVQPFTPEDLSDGSSRSGALEEDLELLQGRHPPLGSPFYQTQVS